MKTFNVKILSPKKSETIEDVVSFTGHDDSGSFNILANASRRMTGLSFGLASCRNGAGKVQYLAIPEGLLYFVSNELKIVTSFYFRESYYEKIHGKIEELLKLENLSMKETKRSMHKLDDEILKRMLKKEFKIGT